MRVSGFASLSSSSEAKCKKEVSFASNEPISVLDTRRSPSPSTSTSTLSSSFGGGNGGGGGSTDNTISLAAVSDNQKWPGSAPPEPGSGDLTDGGRKDEWAAELQPIPAGLEVGAGISERFGLGLEDWESLLSESAASPAQDQSLLRWISGDVDDASFSLKQLLQGGNLTDIDGNVPVGTDIESSAKIGTTSGNVMTNLNSSLAISNSGFSLKNNNGKIGSVSAPNPSALNTNFNPQNPSLPLPQQNQVINPDQKLQIFNPQMMVNQPQMQIIPNSAMFSSLSYNTQQAQHQFQPPPKRHNPGIANSNPQIPKGSYVVQDNEFLLGKMPQLGFANQLNFLSPSQFQPKPFMVPKQESAGGGSQQMAVPNLHQQQQQQAVYDHLYKAAELILAGNFSHAQLILARLNHHLSPMEKPFQRAAFYFKEALQMPLLVPNSAASLPPRVPTPFDGMFKMGAYRVLSEVSPLVQFMNFTSNQALLEAISDADNIHIIDFDIGFGAQWSSFMQELPKGINGVSPSLKITAFASPTTHHPVELGLMNEHLTKFAHEIGVSFELEVVNIDSFDPNSYSIPHFRSSEDETIAVNFPIWSSSSHSFALPSLLRFIKQLSPKIIVSMDRGGCERTELPFSQHLLHALQYYELLLDSIDAANVTSDTANKIERFLFQPRIESMVLGRLRFPDQMPHWKTLLASAGFSPVPLSSFAEAQAECLVKRTQVRGFHVERCEASLVLCWQRRELVSASAWKC